MAGRRTAFIVVCTVALVQAYPAPKAAFSAPCESAAYAVCRPSSCEPPESPFQNTTTPPLGQQPPWPSPHWPSATYLWREMPSEAASRCSVSGRGITCSHSSTQFNIAGQRRTVHYQRPASGAIKGTVSGPITPLSAHKLPVGDHLPRLELIRRLRVCMLRQPVQLLTVQLLM